MQLSKQSTSKDVLQYLQSEKPLSAPQMHALARAIGRDHARALALWDSGVSGARFIAALTDDPARVTPAQMEAWAQGFDSWGIVDCCCCYLFSQARPRWQKVRAWVRRPEEFVRRAGFALLAYLAYKDKEARDQQFIGMLPRVEDAACDSRHFVSKAVNWALRNIGKRNASLNAKAIQTALRIRGRAEKTTDPAARSAARWVCADALRELRSPAVQRRVRGAKRDK